MNIKKVLILLLTFFVCSISCDKKEVTLYGDVTGRILNSRNSEPLQGALVSLTPTNMSTATGSDGTFNFTKLEPQQYSILVTKDGFQSNTTNVTVEPGENRFSDILLTPIDPILSVSTTNLSFGTTETQLPFEITNNGGGALVWSVTESVDWLTVNPSFGETTTETSVVTVTVNRSGLTPNTYSQTFIVISNGGSSTITVSMTVAEGNQAPDAQFTISPESGTTATNFYFDASGSTDDVTGQADLYVRWQWETGGDFSTWTKTKTETHRYNTEGQKVVTLEVRDAVGAVGTASKTIEVAYEEPFITVSNPTSSTSWTVGSSQTISWNHNIAENFKIELYLNDEPLRVIASSVSGGSSAKSKATGAYSWQIPTDLNTSSNYKIKVSSVSNENLYGLSQAFTISAFYINITAPADGAVWEKEWQYSITWEDNITENVKIDLFKGGNLLTNIATSVASNGSYSWEIPSGLTQATDYQVKVNSTTNTSLYTLSNFFSIVDKPYITVSKPDANSYWAASTTQVIEWQTNTSDPVKIDLYKNGTFLLNVVQSTSGSKRGKANEGKNNTYSWEIPSNLTTANTYQVRITSTTSTSVYGTSANFVITEVPYILVSKPNASTSWTPGTTQTIVWTDNISENVNISLYKGETFHSSITSSTASTGSYSWAIPLSLAAADDYKVKITSNSNSGLYGESEPFKIKGYITISKPDASSLWIIGIEQLIEWQDNFDHNVLIQLFKGTNLAYTIAESTSSSGTYNYTPDETLVNGTDYRVKISSIIEPDAIGFSQYFKIKLITLPTVTTNSISVITSTTATCGGNVTSDGGATVTSRGVCWSTSENPTTSNSFTIDGSGAGSFISSISQLIPSTTYYLRSYATNSIGTNYGNQLNFTTPEILVDIEGTEYEVVFIGNQLWMAENLKTIKYNDGTAIAYPGNDNSEWGYNTSGAYAWYNNYEEAYKDTYGALYNWHAVNTGKLCPLGWHVATDWEWYTMENYVDSTINDPGATYWRGTDGGSKLKTTNGWNSNGNGTDDYSFSALPGGHRNPSGGFDGEGSSGSWWTASESGTYAWSRMFLYSQPNIYRSYSQKDSGCSVRCIKD